MKRHIKTTFILLTLLLTSSADGVYYRDPFYGKCAFDYYRPLCMTLTVEGLAWRAVQNELDFAVDGTDTDHVGPEEAHYAVYDWAAGIRVGLGWRWSCDGEFRITYTNYNNDRRTSIDKTLDEDTFLYPTLYHPASPETVADYAQITQKVQFESEEFLISQAITSEDCSIRFRPFFGVRLIQLKQYSTTQYTGGDFNIEDENIGTVDWISKMGLYGLHGGFEANYFARCGTGLFAELACSILGGYARNTHNQYIVEPDATLDYQIQLSEKQYLTIPCTQAKLGVFYDFPYCGLADLRWKLSYEFHHMYNVPQIKRYDPVGEAVSGSYTQGQLGFHGATFGVEAYF